jgi:magnesium chelatase family protein
LIGGGSPPRPGEITLAQHGVLFLDELPEFDRRVLEVLREPMESGHIVISRAARQETFPARFQLVAAMNPCPCGYRGDEGAECRCTEEQVLRYRARISGPLLDRIDMQIDVPRVPVSRLGRREGEPPEASAPVAARVRGARERQTARGGINSRLENATLERFCSLDGAARGLLERAIERLRLSARGYYRVLRVARTIADLAGCTAVEPDHVAEAIGYRRLDRSR